MLHIKPDKANSQHLGTDGFKREAFSDGLVNISSSTLQCKFSAIDKTPSACVGQWGFHEMSTTQGVHVR